MMTHLILYIGSAHECWYVHLVYVVVIGGAKEIDWFAPTGEKIEPGRLDISVIRNDETSATLTIYNAKVDNAGTYKCVASSGDREAEATVNLKIYRKIWHVWFICAGRIYTEEWLN